MSDWLSLLMTIAIAAVGSTIGSRLKLPAGALLGAIFSVGAYQLLTGNAWCPDELKFVSTAITGAVLGAKVTRADLRSLSKIPFAAATMLIGMFSYNFICCFVLNKAAGLDPTTAILSTAPGGLTEMSLAALDLSPDPATVSSIQVVRLVTVALITPMLLKFILKHWKHEKSIPSPAEEEARKPKDKSRKAALITLVIGLAAGWVGDVSNLPAGTLCVAMVACVVYNLRSEKAYLPDWLRRAAQCANGAIIGARLLIDNLILLRDIFLVVLVLTLGWIALNLILGWILHRFGGLSPETSLFATAAGGMSDMGLIAAELGGNPAQVSVLQMCRVICVIALCPTIATLLG